MSVAPAEAGAPPLFVHLLEAVLFDVEHQTLTIALVPDSGDFDLLGLVVQLLGSAEGRPHHIGHGTVLDDASDGEDATLMGPLRRPDSNAREDTLRPRV